jgi:hypothetical protein
MESLFAKEELEIEIVELKIQLLSLYYPFKTDEIRLLKGHLNIEYLSRNENVLWTIELFQLLKDYFDWSTFHRIKKINFGIDVSFLMEFEKYIDFDSIYMSNNVDWSLELFKSFKEKLSHKIIYRSNLLFSNKEVFEFFESNIEWDLLSRSTNLEFTIEFIVSYKSLINWKIFSRNPKIPISVDFIKQFENLIDFDELSQNPSCLELILKYSKSKKWNWKRVVYNPAIEFNDNNINFYIEHFNKYLIEIGKVKVFNKNFPGYLVRHLMVIQYKKRNYFIQDKYMEFIPWDIFCKNCNTQMTLLEFEQFKSKLDFKSSQFLTANKNIIGTDFISKNIELFDTQMYSFYCLPLTIEIIEKCSNISFKNLSSCDKLNWTWQFIEENFEKLNVYSLSKNKALYDLMDLSNPIIPELNILFPLKVGDVISISERGNTLYCINEINEQFSIGFRNKYGEVFYESDISKFHKHDNITSIEFDLDSDIETHKKRIYKKAYQEVESLENEVWKEVNGFDKLFVSNMGRIISKSGALRSRFLKMSANSNGHLFIMRKKKASSPNWSYQVALIVAETFLPNPKRYKYISHINNDISDNRLENLEWVKHGKIEKTPYQERLEKQSDKNEKYDSDKSDFYNEFDRDYHSYNESHPNSDLRWLDEETDGHWRWNID